MADPAGANAWESAIELKPEARNPDSEVRRSEAEAASGAGSKGALRAAMRQRLLALTAGQRGEQALKAGGALREQDLWRRAESVLCYAALSDELDLSALVGEALATGKRLAFPAFDPASDAYRAWFIQDPARDLAPGKFGIPEPAAHCRRAPAVERVDLILVPGLAFTPAGWRLGRGKGFYDRLLAAVAGARCGVAFEFQVVRQLPAEPHDVRVDFVLTPGRWRICERPAGDDA